MSSVRLSNVLILVLFALFAGSHALRNVNLTIVPPVVNKSSSAVLYCDYDLEGAPLYSVKWYRGEKEFYRYTETEEVKVRVFDIDGFEVNVARSNSTQVFLWNISDFKHSGHYSCEVTDDGQPISSVTDVQTMLVVQLPSSPPVISVSHKPFDYYDILRANCSSPPSKPQAILRMSLNNMVIGRTNMTLVQKFQDPVWSDLSIVKSLSEFDFNQGGGRLILECVSQVAGYESNAVLELASARHPVPERVSAFGSSAGSRPVGISTSTTMQLIMLALRASALMFIVNS